jgi:adenylate cyclase
MLRHLLYPYLHNIYFKGVDIVNSDASWDTLWQLFLFYNIVVGLLINFINQVNKKYGPGVLLPMLMGRYRKPKEEEMIFLFMDLKSSTPIAESLGHLQYSAFIRDSFLDINSLLAAYNAQVYQYVGDEIVITWSIEEGLKDFACIEFFFACQDKFQKDKDIYMKRYNQIPLFKAGLHMGKVTAVEVGDIKRDIAYHGDTLNTAARIQSVCSQYNKRMLTSSYIWRNTGVEDFYTFESLGPVGLKGKSNPLELLSIARR